MIEIRVTSSKQNYEFSIYQKITVIRGKSGTGKSQFFRLISDAWSEDVHILLRQKLLFQTAEKSL